MSLSADTTTDIRTLAAHCAGAVTFPGDEGWDAARSAFNLTVDQRPAAVAFPVSADDVAAVVRFARARGLRVAPQATGHNAGPLGDLGATILLKTSAMTGFEIDPAARRARVSAGQTWAEVCDAASAHGLAALSGSARSVGVVGYSLGGGMGFLARSHGLQANAVTAADVVLADGRIVRADADHEPELFWAIRGGGGNFGVVTALEFELFAIEELHAGVLFFELERAGEALEAWRRLTLDAPEEVTSVGRIMQFPPAPDVPEPLRGKAFALVEVISTLDAAATDKLVAELRAHGPVMDTIAPVEPAALSHLHMDPPHPVPAITNHTLTGPLPAEAVAALVSVAGAGSGSPLVSVELRHCGGALARTDARHGALARLDGEYCLFAVGAPMGPGAADAIHAHMAMVQSALAPWAAGRYGNFTEQPADTRTMFDADTYARLQRARAAYDPDGILRANHAVA